MRSARRRTRIAAASTRGSRASRCRKSDGWRERRAGAPGAKRRGGARNRESPPGGRRLALTRSGGAEAEPARLPLSPGEWACLAFAGVVGLGFLAHEIRYPSAWDATQYLD